jgi:hypothetical protein
MNTKRLEIKLLRANATVHCLLFTASGFDGHPYHHACSVSRILCSVFCILYSVFFPTSRAPDD